MNSADRIRDKRAAYAPNIGHGAEDAASIP